MQFSHSYLLTLSYDGTAYKGWQEQKDLPTIEGTVQQVFTRTFNLPLHIIGASRTDAGVHALGQIIRLDTDLAMEPHKLGWVLNNSLPAEILVRRAQSAPADFHPWYKVHQKIYYYHFFVERPLPFLARWGWYPQYRLDIPKLKEALSQFVGTHNFRSFACAQDQREDMIRTINMIELSYIARYKVYRIEIRGAKFLRHMIRRIVGACLFTAAAQHRPIEALIAVKNSANPHHFLPTAPAQGLLLRKIYYR